MYVYIVINKILILIDINLRKLTEIHNRKQLRATIFLVYHVFAAAAVVDLCRKPPISTFGHKATL